MATSGLRTNEQLYLAIGVPTLVNAAMMGLLIAYINARATAPVMAPKDQGGGSIITLTYLGSTRVVENYNVMGVAKAALEATMRYLASDLGPSNIRVNAISAGAVKTASARGIRGFSKMLEGAAQLAPLRRNTDPARSGRHRCFPGQRPGPRRHRQRSLTWMRACKSWDLPVRNNGSMSSTSPTEH